MNGEYIFHVILWSQNDLKRPQCSQPGTENAKTMCGFTQKRQGSTLSQSEGASNDRDVLIQYHSFPISPAEYAEGMQTTFFAPIGPLATTHAPMIGVFETPKSRFRTLEPQIDHNDAQSASTKPTMHQNKHSISSYSPAHSSPGPTPGCSCPHSPSRSAPSNSQSSRSSPPPCAPSASSHSRTSTGSRPSPSCPGRGMRHHVIIKNSRDLRQNPWFQRLREYHFSTLSAQGLHISHPFRDPDDLCCICTHSDEYISVG